MFTVVSTCPISDICVANLFEELSGQKCLKYIREKLMKLTSLAICSGHKVALNVCMLVSIFRNVVAVCSYYINGDSIKCFIFVPLYSLSGEM
jgi:hypothetical protein